MITRILILKILELFGYLFLGIILVKTKILKNSFSNILAKINIYVIMTCSLLNAFQVKANNSIKSGLIVAGISFLVFQIINVALGKGYRKFFKANIIDELAISFPNVANLTIPLIGAILGKEWIIYLGGPIIIFNLFWWTYGISQFEDKRIDLVKTLKKIITNPNIIALCLGLLCFFFDYQIKGQVKRLIEFISSLIGPISFMVVGMALANIRLSDLLKDLKALLTVMIRMIVVPLLVILSMWLFKLTNLIDNGYQIMMIVLLAISAPTANMVNQFAIIYDYKKEYANVVVLLTTLSSIITMPLIIFIYELLLKC